MKKIGASLTLTKDAAADTLLLRPPGVLSLPPVEFSLATQPGYGNRIFLLANHFRVRFQNNELYHYDVNIVPEPPKGYSVIMETFKQQARLSKMPYLHVTDTSLYTSKPLSNLVELEVVLSHGQGGELGRLTFLVVWIGGVVNIRNDYSGENL